MQIEEGAFPTEESELAEEQFNTERGLIQKGSVSVSDHDLSNVVQNIDANYLEMKELQKV